MLKEEMKSIGETTTLVHDIDNSDMPIAARFAQAAARQDHQVAESRRPASSERVINEPDHRPQMWEKILSTGHVWYARASNWNDWWAPLTKIHKMMLPIAFFTVIGVFIATGSVFGYTAAKIKQVVAETPTEEAVTDKDGNVINQDVITPIFRVIERVKVPATPAVAQAADYTELRDLIVSSLNSTGKLPETPGLNPWPASNVLNPESAAWLAAGNDTYFIAVVLKDGGQNDAVWFGAAHKMKELKPGETNSGWEMVNIVTPGNTRGYSNNLIMDNSLKTVLDADVQLALFQAFSNIAH